MYRKIIYTVKRASSLSSTLVYYLKSIQSLLLFMPQYQQLIRDPISFNLYAVFYKLTSFEIRITFRFVVIIDFIFRYDGLMKALF